MDLFSYLIHKGFKSYDEYLLSDEWKELRQKALNKYHNRCVICGDKENLQVHHTNYRDMENPDLVVLCTDCHKFFHEVIQDKCEKVLNDMNLKLAQKYIELELEYRQRASIIVSAFIDEFIKRKQKLKVADINITFKVFNEILHKNKKALYYTIEKETDARDKKSTLHQQIMSIEKQKRL